MDHTEIRQLILGVDVGGSHITAGLVNLYNRTVVPGSTTRSSVDAHASAEDIIGVWSDTIRRAYEYKAEYVKKIGIAMPGPFDYGKGISLIRNMNKYESLYGLSIKEQLAEKLNFGPEDIKFRNDAEAFLHGEVFCGAARGSLKTIGITLGTGLGSARSENGITEDVNLGSSPFLDGIAEDYISTRWFIKRYHELSGRSLKDVKELTEYIGKDEKVRTVFDEFSRNLALFLTGFIHSEEPDTVIIGGNIARAFPLFEQQLKKHLPEFATEVSVFKAGLGEEASLIGAACLWQAMAPESVTADSVRLPEQ